MKFLAAVVLALSLPGSYFSTPSNATVKTAVKPAQAHKGGIWYMAESGHAVYCMGPVVLVTEPDGGLQRVATFCQGEKAIVPLKD